MSDLDNYTPAVAWAAEGARVGIVTCERCGAAVLLSRFIDAMALHDDWHDGKVNREEEPSEVYVQQKHRQEEEE